MNQVTEATGTIHGRVTSPEGEPVQDATVMIAGDSPSHRDIAALTNEQGEYRFTDLIPGDYMLLVNAEGHPMQTQHVRVKAGKIARPNTSLI